MSVRSQALKRALQTRAYKKITSLTTGKSLPILDKQSYINRNQFRDLIPAGEPMPEFVYASSGSTGKPSFWFRDLNQEKIGGAIHERIVRDNWQIKKAEPTLAVVCFSMGVWIAGVYTADSFRQLARRGYNLTVVTPGIEKTDIIFLLASLGPSYKNIIIAAYPPFLMDIMVEIKKKCPQVIKQKIFFLTAGDKFSERWRNDFLTLIEKPENKNFIVNIYGSADIGMMGYETPFTIAVRQQLATNRNLRRALSGIDSYRPELPSTLPGLYQYDPAFVNFEELAGELVVTANNAIPLIRYNIHDLGRVITGREMALILKRNDLLEKFEGLSFRPQKDRFVLLRGRSDVAVTFYALNIYPDNIRAGLENRAVAKYVTGDYSAYSKDADKSRRQEFHLDVEIAPNVKLNQKIKKLIEDSLVKNLTKLNAEFRKLLASIGDRAIPIISLTPYGQMINPFGKRSLIHRRGKKPRILIK